MASPYRVCVVGMTFGLSHARAWCRLAPRAQLTAIAEKDANSFTTLASVATKIGARTMALDPASGRLYLVAADMTVNPSVDPLD